MTYAYISRSEGKRHFACSPPTLVPLGLFSAELSFLKLTLGSLCVPLKWITHRWAPKLRLLSPVSHLPGWLAPCFPPPDLASRLTGMQPASLMNALCQCANEWTQRFKKPRLLSPSGWSVYFSCEMFLEHWNLTQMEYRLLEKPVGIWGHLHLSLNKQQHVTINTESAVSLRGTTREETAQHSNTNSLLKETWIKLVAKVLLS